ncbi:MAG: CPBP family intramembrane metalloprotease [Clostridia bacterium]|nr:CPBP family intramembrane metalloprotease [Clostridia bacterium]
MHKSARPSKALCISGAAVGIAIIVILRILSPQYTGNDTHNTIIDTIISRCVAAAIFALLIANLGHKVFSADMRCIWLTIPCLAVAINNMPIISLFRGDAYISDSWTWIGLFALQCVAVAVYEEIAFRGVLLMLILGRRKGKKAAFEAVIVSSAVFALFHLLNLLDGAGIGQTIMQVGYSFLVGGMCAVLMLICGSIYPSILVHATYNFCGYIVPTLGGGTWWDTPTIIITAVLAVFTGVTVTVTLYKKADFIMINQ